MRKLIFTIAALGIVGLTVPAGSANAQSTTVVIKKDRDHDRDWRRHHAQVVIVKHHRRHHWDHDHHD